MSTKSSFLSKFDVFGSPYQYIISQNKYKKQTTVGGLFSILLFVFILAYFIYIIIKIDSGQISPKFLQFDEMSDQGYEYKLSKNFILSTYEGLLQKELQEKIQYFDIILRVGNDTNDQYVIVDSHYNEKKSLVFDLTNLTLRSHPKHYTLGNIIFIQISKCSGNFLRKPDFRCATQEELDQLFQQQLFQVIIGFQQDGYSIKKQNFYETNLIKVFELRSDKVNMFNIYCLKAQEISIKKGLFFQSTQTYKQIYSFQKESQVYQQNNTQGFGGAFIYLDNQVKYTEMEYIQFTEVLAQIWAITSLLLLSRYIFQFISRVYIAQDFQGILLKYYYKKTALKLQEKNIQMDQDFSNLDYRQKAQKIKKQNDEIQTNTNHFNVSRYERWKIFLVPSFCLKRKKQSNQNQLLLNNLKKQLNKDMCFYEMQKEFLRLKTAVKLLLSPEQYAAIHMCGCDLIDYEKRNKIQQNQTCQQKDNQVNQLQEISDKESNLSVSDIQNPINSHQLEDYIHKQQSSSLQFKNHLELMEKVDVDSEYRQNCLERFLKDIQQIQGSEQIAINQRILNCMIGIQDNQLYLRDCQEKKNNPHHYIEYQEYQNNFYNMNS
ncbi:hypothetical protein ABPG74_004620 [Tetrahymena malaccensis]